MFFSYMGYKINGFFMYYIVSLFIGAIIFIAKYYFQADLPILK